MKISINQVQSAFVYLGEKMLAPDEQLEAVIHRASVHNSWFTKEEITNSFRSIAEQYLEKTKLKNWKQSYPQIRGRQKKVALIMAGNLPLVGFHDLLSTIMAGHKAQIKLSEKDPYLIPWVINELTKYSNDLADQFEIVSRLTDFDAVIATGSNNSARYFHQYFKEYPHIIRKNRNGVAILNGEENKDQLIGLAKDIFSYFGLGCRNVSKLYLPKEYNFEDFVNVINNFKDLINHHKYKNNVDYNAAIHILNKIPNISFQHIILIEEKMIPSRIGVLHYSYYENIDQLKVELLDKENEIQCIVCDQKHKMDGFETFDFGKAQKPSLSNYADGIDTMKFLTEL